MEKKESNNPFMGEKLEKIIKENLIKNFQQQPVIPYVMYEVKLPTSDDIPENGVIEQPLALAAMKCELVNKETAIRLQVRPDVTMETLLWVLQGMEKMIKMDYEKLQIRVLTDFIGADEKLKNAH